VVAGSFLFLGAMALLAHLSLDAGAGDLFWPLILRGVGLGLIFVPLTNAAMADLSFEDLAQGTGMFNLTRQLGGSLGIAIMATLLTRFTKVARALLSEHVVAGNVDVQHRLDMIARGLVAHGVSPYLAPQQALVVLDMQIGGQASVLAFSKLYLLSGIILVAALPLMLLFRTGKGRAAMGMPH
jgi:DHA2 family multidrug resistance protein